MEDGRSLQKGENCPAILGRYWYVYNPNRKLKYINVILQVKYIGRGGGECTELGSYKHVLQKSFLCSPPRKVQRSA